MKRRDFVARVLAALGVGAAIGPDLIIPAPGQAESPPPALPPNPWDAVHALRPYWKVANFHLDGS